VFLTVPGYQNPANAAELLTPAALPPAFGGQAAKDGIILVSRNSKKHPPFFPMEQETPPQHPPQNRQPDDAPPGTGRMGMGLRLFTRQFFYKRTIKKCFNLLPGKQYTKVSKPPLSNINRLLLFFFSFIPYLFTFLFTIM